MFEQIFQNSAIPTFVINDNHIITHWNLACERLTGFSADNMVGTGKQWVAFYPQQQPVLADFIVEKATLEEVVSSSKNPVQISSNTAGGYETEGYFPDQSGKNRWLFFTATPLRDEQGEIIGAIETVQDATTHKQNEEALIEVREELVRQVEQRTAKLVAINADLKNEIAKRKRVEEDLRFREKECRNMAAFTCEWVYLTDSAGRFICLSSVFEAITGYKRKEFIDNAHLLASIAHPDDQMKMDAYLEAEKRSEGLFHMDFRIITHGGEERWISHYSQPVFDSEGNYFGRRGSNRDITKRKQRETKLREEREKLETRVEERTRALSLTCVRLQKEIAVRNRACEALQFTRFSINHANDMIGWIDYEGNIVDVNETICSKLKYSRNELLSITAIDVWDGLTLDTIHKNWNKIKRREIWGVETSYSCKDGEKIPVEMHITPVEFNGKEYQCIFARDIKKRKELERFVAINEKMSSLGRVAAGIAHEIRNPLSTINVYLSTMKVLFEDESFDVTYRLSLQDAVSEIEIASRKIEDVVKLVMDFSKPSQHVMQLINVNQFVRDAVELSAATLRKSGVILNVQLDEEIPEGYFDGQLIEQLMVNLITNAREELIQWQGEKQIEIRTTAKGHDEGKQFIVITIADSGPGIPADLRDKIFDPFFTTKHYGFGIGLSLCHRIILDHHGSLHVRSSKWGGALFVAELPVKKEKAKG